MIIIARNPPNWAMLLLKCEIKLIFKQYFETYCHSVKCVWKLDSNKKIVRVARYIVKCLLNPVASMKWAIALNSLPELHLWFNSNPRMLLKPGRHYINRNYDFDLRTQVIFNHYLMLSKFLSKSSFLTLAKGGSILLVTIEGKTGQRYQITLEKTGKFDREGELVLQLSDCTGDVVVFRFVFSLNIFGDYTGLEIGCIQGPKGEGACEIIKRASKELYGIRPKNLLADALYALASTWNLTEFFGVSNKSRVYQDNQTHADYDSFWLELGSTLGRNGMFRLPSMLHHSRLSEIKSHHRSEYRRRIELRGTLGKQILIAASNFGT